WTDLHQGFQSNLVKVALPTFFLPPFEFFVGVLDLHNRAVDEDANGNSNPGETHDVRRDPHEIHRDERERDGDGDGDDRHNRRRDVPEKKQDHKADNDHFHDQVVFQIVDGLSYQLRTVVGRNDLHALWHG